MALVANRRSVMTLFSAAVCPYSHRTRIVLAEKNITVEVVNIDPDNKPEDLIDLNPYQTVPTLVDRELVLYGSRVIMEYLDERFPHPPLMPVDPVSRARARLMLVRFDRDWYSLLPEITDGDKKVAQRARTVIRDGLSVISPVFKDQQFVMGEEFTLVDCALAPLLWRLDYYGIQLPRQARPILDYAERLFARKAFKLSLTEPEKEMRKG